MQLGAFSISLSVQDLAVSEAFYATLGFRRFAGGEQYAILKNGETTIGLFQGMFEGNILTFNPGWNHEAATVEGFTDVRELESTLKAAGVEPVASNTADSVAGPANIVLVDPDGNSILIDQHL